MIANRPQVQTEIGILRPLLPEGATVVDVGSNHGNFFAPFLDDGCAVISVEANARNVRFQRVRFDDYLSSQQLTVYHRGCADISQTAILFIDDGLAGTISTFDRQWAQEYFPGAYSRGLQESHQLIRLDTLLAAHFAELRRSFGLLKIDTEGFDLKVLRGYFSGTAAVPPPMFVMFELHTSPAGMATAHEGIELLIANHFDRFRLHVRHGQHVLADSPWLTARQILRVSAATLNEDRFGYGAGIRHGNIIATRSCALAQAQISRLQSPSPVAGGLRA